MLVRFGLGLPDEARLGFFPEPLQLFIDGGYS